MSVQQKLSKGHILRALVSQRLAAAAEEIFGLFERTIGEYEDEQRKLLDHVLKRPLSDVQQPLVVEEAVSPEQREWISGLDREDSEPPHIKEEQVELRTIQKGEQLQGLEQAGFNFPFTSVTVKIEDDVERKAQSSQFPESQTEEDREAERLKTEADEDVCGGSGSASNSNPDGPFLPATRGETSSSSESLSDGETSYFSKSESDGNDVPVGDDKRNTGCVEEARTFVHGAHLPKHSTLGVHSDGKHFSCPVCKTSFSSSYHLVRHTRTHTGEKPFSCSVCGKKFALNQHMIRHLVVHSGEKPFSCSFCGKGFSHRSNLKQHMVVHTGEKPFSCSFCGKGFSHLSNLKQHIVVHTGEKPFSCILCGRGFTQHSSLKRHLTGHRGETI